MQTYKTLNDIIALAEFAHRNQTDKAGMPYIEHPKRVMQSVQNQGAMPYVQMAAVLHDVTEDTAFSPEILLTLGVPEAAVSLVKLLDRRHSDMVYRVLDPFWDNVDSKDENFRVKADEFYYSELSKNPQAKMVKLADIHDNTQEWRLVYLPDATQRRLRNKYAKARRALLGKDAVIGL